MYGDGLQRRDWLYVEDNVRAVLAVLERDSRGRSTMPRPGRSAPTSRSRRPVRRALAARTVDAPQALLDSIRHVPDRPGHDRRYAVVTDRIRDDLGWRPLVAFEQGLEWTLDWYVAHEDWLARVMPDDQARDGADASARAARGAP